GKAEEAAGSAAVAAQSKSSAESAATRAENAARRAEEIASAVGLEDASTTTKGVVRLSNRTDSTSQTEAATSLAVSNVMNEVKTKAPLDSPAFTGTPTTPTPPDNAAGLETANAAFVRKLLAALVDSSPEAL
ncbi:TPA: tail fiber protein, partial [Escherichia coli]|nr:tail fiber protein [Escherichia coli]HCP1653464.1 tail fiber protein [Escherichia coli]